MPVAMQTKRMRITLPALVLLAAALGAGCGSGGAPSERPQAFSLMFSHYDGSVPPPYHAEWMVTVAPDRRARVIYIPDYEGTGVPSYRSSFRADPHELDALYRRLREKGLLSGDLEEAAASPGGSYDTATIDVDGERYAIPAFVDGSRPVLEAFEEQVSGLVPTRTWDSFLQRRRRYALARYGRAP